MRGGAVTTTQYEPVLDQTTDFARMGFAVLARLLTDDELQEARGAVNSALAKPTGITCERPNNTLVALRWRDRLVNLIGRHHGRVGDVVGATDLRWISGYISIKDGKSPPLWWHQDWWAWDHAISLEPAPVQIAVLCYLSDTTLNTGALRVLPGSHRRSVPLHRLLPEAHSDESTALSLGHPAMIDQPGQISLEVRAGDAVVTDYRLLHGTHANVGAHRRDCVLLSFAPNWGYLPVDLRGHLIQHPALPQPGEDVSHVTATWPLPTFDGLLCDLTLNRNAPAAFDTAGEAPPDTAGEPTLENDYLRRGSPLELVTGRDGPPKSTKTGWRKSS
jgi:hypothetical protein